MSFSYRARALAPVVALLALAACAADPVRPDATVVSTVSLTSDANAPLASLGDTAKVAVRVLDARGTSLSNVPLRWTATPNGVLQRDADGIYRAIGNGRVTLVAEVDVGATGVRPSQYYATRVADSVTIEVKQQPARLSFAPIDTAFGTLGARRQLRVSVTDARGNAMIDGPPALTWSTSNAGVVQVDTAGIVRSSGEGAAQIVVRSATLAGALLFTVSPRMPHTSCMVFAQRRQTRQSCVTLDFVVREREDGR